MPIPVDVKAEGLTVERLLWQAYGRPGQTAAMLRATLELNRGLAALGPILPLRTKLTLPDLPRAKAAGPAPRATVPLFDDED